MSVPATATSLADGNLVAHGLVLLGVAVIGLGQRTCEVVADGADFPAIIQGDAATILVRNGQLSLIEAEVFMQLHGGVSSGSECFACFRISNGIARLTGCSLNAFFEVVEVAADAVFGTAEQVTDGAFSGGSCACHLLASLFDWFWKSIGHLTRLTPDA